MNLDDALKIINEYSASDFHKHGNIPPKKLEAARLYPVDPEDTPLALVDATVFGSAKCGMVIGLKGIYWKNDWTTKTNKSFLSWEDLSGHADKLSSSFMEVTLAPGCIFNMAGSQMKSDMLIVLLRRLCKVSKVAALETKEETAADVWHLAIDGESIGTFQVGEAIELISHKGHDPEKVMAWKAGMEGWSVVSQVPELAALLVQSLKAKAMTPPPIPQVPGVRKSSEGGQSPEDSGSRGSGATGKSNEQVVGQGVSSPQNVPTPSTGSLLVRTHQDTLFSKMQSLNTVDNVLTVALSVLLDNGVNTEIAKDFRRFMIRVGAAFRKEVVEKRKIPGLANDLATIEVSGMAIFLLATTMQHRRVPAQLSEQVILEGIRETFNIQGTVQSSRIGNVMLNLLKLYEPFSRERQEVVLFFLAARLVGGNLTSDIHPDYDMEALIEKPGKDALFEDLMDKMAPGLENFYKEAVLEANLLVGTILDKFPGRQ